jgi:hypothetical protein
LAGFLLLLLLLLLLLWLLLLLLLLLLQAAAVVGEAHLRPEQLADDVRLPGCAAGVLDQRHQHSKHLKRVLAAGEAAAAAAAAGQSAKQIKHSGQPQNRGVARGQDIHNSTAQHSSMVLQVCSNVCQPCYVHTGALPNCCGPQINPQLPAPLI